MFNPVPLTRSIVAASIFTLSTVNVVNVPTEVNPGALDTPDPRAVKPKTVVPFILYTGFGLPDVTFKSKC